MVKNLPANAEAAGDEGSIPRSGRSPGGWQFTPVFLPGEFHGRRSLGYSPRVAKSRTRLSDFTFTMSGKNCHSGEDQVKGS